MRNTLLISAALLVLGGSGCGKVADPQEGPSDDAGALFESGAGGQSGSGPAEAGPTPDGALPADAPSDSAGPPADASPEAGAGGGGGDASLPMDPVVAALVDSVEQARYEADIAFVAQPRTPGSPHWQQVQDLCASRFGEFGYQVEKQSYGSGVNVIGTKLGSDLPDEQLLISAHYDHLRDCPGADDNASGVAATLELARVMALDDFRRTLVVACFDEEERGLIGSEAYADRARQAGQNIVANYVYDTIAYVTDIPNSQQMPAGFGLLYPDKLAELQANENKGNFILILHDTRSNQPAALQLETARQINLLAATVEITDELMNSGALNDIFRADQASFWLDAYPGILITDTADFRYPSYHCQNGPDVVANLNIEFATKVVKSTVGSAARVLEIQ